MNISFDFIGPINDESFLALRNYIVSQPNQISHLTINISSLGGSVITGITAYNFLKHLPFTITTHNLGEVSSAAILLYLAGNTRTAESFSKFMIHPISLGVNSSLSYHNVQELLRGIEADIRNYQNITNLETNFLNGKYNIEYLLKGDSLVLDTESAYECGIVNKHSV